MKPPLVPERQSATSRDLRAGCFVCHGTAVRWTSSNAQALAAQHHDRTGHATWCDIAMMIRYGRTAPDDRQTDIEDVIAFATVEPTIGGDRAAWDRRTIAYEAVKKERTS